MLQLFKAVHYRVRLFLSGVPPDLLVTKHLADKRDRDFLFRNHVEEVPTQTIVTGIGMQLDQALIIHEKQCRAVINCFLRVCKCLTPFWGPDLLSIPLIRVNHPMQRSCYRSIVGYMLLEVAYYLKELFLVPCHTLAPR